MEAEVEVEEQLMELLVDQVAQEAEVLVLLVGLVHRDQLIQVVAEEAVLITLQLVQQEAQA
jgi:hypothetical protein